MITLTLAVPDANAIILAGFAKIRGYRHSGGPGGALTATAPDIPLVQDVTSYTLVDAPGVYGDWYSTVYLDGANHESSHSLPQPSYLSDLCATVRDLLGVTLTEVTDAQIQGPAYLPAAYSVCRQRIPVGLPTSPAFDALIASIPSDVGYAALGALAHLTAAYLCHRMKVALADMVRIKDFQLQRNRQLDWDATAAALVEKYNELIGLASGETALDGTVYLAPLHLAGPTRAGANTSGGLGPILSLPADTNPLGPYIPRPN